MDFMVVLEQLASLVAEETRFLGGVRGGIDELRDDLSSMKSFLQDAEERSESDPGLRAWVKQVRDVAYDAEDILEEFMLRFSPSHGSGFVHFLRDSYRSTLKLSARHRLAAHLESIKARVKAISERRNAFSLNRIDMPSTSSAAVEKWHDPRIASLYLEEADVVGIENPKHLLVSWLVEGEEKLSSISVDGMGGLGKTTLVKKVYDSHPIRRSFDAHSWVTVSKSFASAELLRVALQGFLVTANEPVPDNLQSMTDVQLIDALRKYLWRRSNNDLGSLRRILQLSYDDLPYYLKQCYLYLSVFPEDHLIKRMKLIPLWIVERLTSLQKLVSVEVNEDYESVRELGKLTQLRRLGILKLREDQGMDLCYTLERLKHLTAMYVVSLNKTDFLQLDSISSPPKYLQRLYLKCSLSALPGWIASLQYISKLVLQYSNLKNDPLKALQKLPSLVVLELRQAYAGEELCCDPGGFSKLKRLGLHELERLQRVGIAKGSMPGLERLDITACTVLETVPDGIENLKNIEDLVLWHMPSTFIKTVERRRGEDFWRVQHITTITRMYKDGGLEWKKVRDCLATELKSNNDLGSLRRILQLSYDNLPYYLKQCYLYLSVFPEDYLIKRMELIRLWIVERFVEEKQGFTMEEVAEEYLNELVNRSLIQVVEMNYFNRVKTCRVHDLMREIIQLKSREESLVMIANGTRISKNEKVRRLSIHENSEEVQSDMRFPYLWSFLSFSSHHSFEHGFRNYKLLRVLNLDRAPFSCFPPELVELIHLRYLSLRWTMIRELPESIRKLKYLERLDLQGSTVSSLPTGITQRYVIVLDDVWDVNAWETIKYAFPDCNCGSRIIFTTRIGNLAESIENTTHVYDLQPLPENEAWTLFCMKAFRGEPKAVCPPELEDMSRDILRKCEGLPLAIVAIGGLLSKKKNEGLEWKKVRDCLATELKSNNDLGSLRRILQLSYDNLPCYLKQCYLYLSVFPEDHLIKRMKLIRLWIVERFVEEKQGFTMEEVAEEYLNELVNRSLIQVAEMNHFNRVKTCRVHDLMREIILLKSREESLVMIANGTRISKNEKVRRLSIHENSEEVQSDMRFPYLWSFLSFSSHHSFEHGFRNYKLLRVLNLDRARFPSFPPELVDLIHLRYLSLRWTTIRELPESIRKLKYLEILDLKGSTVSSLPTGITQLTCLCQLRHYRHSFWSSLFFPDTHGMRVPSGIGRLTSLQKLGSVEVNEDNKLVRELGKLTQLRRLGILKLREEQGMDLCYTLERLKHLTAMYVVSLNKTDFLQLDSISSPPKYLQRLYLKCSLSALPGWIASLQYISKLVLQYSNLKNDPLKALQKLPSLVVLELRQAYAGEELCCDPGGFSKLKKLGLHELERLQRVGIAKGSMPGLDRLDITACTVLETVPDGIENLKNIEDLVLWEMPSTFIKTVERRRGEDFWRVQHITTITCIYESRGRWDATQVELEAFVEKTTCSSAVYRLGDIVFPEDYLIKRMELIPLWIVERFVEEKQGFTMEEVAEEYLNELVNRSLIQVAEMDYFNRVKKCRVHDLMREIILLKSREESLVMIANGTRISKNEKVRRLSIHENTEEVQSELRFPYLWSFLLFSSHHSFEHGFRNYKLLRVLTLDRAHFSSFLPEVVELIHLRYLSLRWTMIRELPESIGSSRSTVSSLPSGITQLTCLCQLLNYRYSLHSSWFFGDTHGMRVPSGIGRLTSLQKLVGVEVNEDNELVREVGKLTQLRKLGILKLREDQGMDLCYTLERLKHLNSLYLISLNKTDVFQLDSISSPPKYLQRLYLECSLSALPGWIASLQYISKLVLRYSNLKSDPLKALQKLPSLVVLQLRQAYAGEELWCDPGGFSKLKRLGFHELERLQRVGIAKGSMPGLERLDITACTVLEKVPDGIENLKNIEHLFLVEMPSTFIKTVERRRGEDFWRVQHITTITRWWCELKNLEQLDLSGNNLEGSFPDCLGNLSSLQLLDVSGNRFTGNIASGPLTSIIFCRTCIYIYICAIRYEISSFHGMMEYLHGRMFDYPMRGSSSIASMFYRPDRLAISIILNLY
uniref:Rx N-terminal domain-containing protein n=1 Tax=Salix viminalis TaxID=40686 RepID=A0A6N2MD30_SALVM